MNSNSKFFLLNECTLSYLMHVKSQKLVRRVKKKICNTVYEGVTVAV